MERSAIGVDIGGTRLRVAHIAADGTILARATADSSADPETVVARVEALIDGLDARAASAIGIGVPGRVDGRRALSGGFVDLSGIAVAERIESRFGLPVVIDNDCTMALVAEAALGAAERLRNVVMLTIGTGIGGAILDDGRVLRGRATAGQLGHISVDPGGEVCVCGKRGCVETMSSGTALGRHIARAGLPAGTTVAELLTAREGGDQAATLVLRDWAAPLRVAIETLVTTVDPELVVLGGGLGEAAVAALSTIPAAKSWFECRVVHATLGDDAGIVGAGIAALKAQARAGKRVVLVNGVPASGKSHVAEALSREAGWPLLSLDTIKDPFLQEIDDVDRPFNRKLGRASMKAMFATFAAAPDGATIIMDAWFGFQPREWVVGLMECAGATDAVELWCVAPPETIGKRYAARTGDRLPGHPGAGYVPELVALAARAEPMRIGQVIDIDTTVALDADTLRDRVGALFASRKRLTP